MVPEDRVDVVIASGEGAMTSDKVADLVWAGFAESATATVKLAVPMAVGVPEIRPVDVLKLRPAGRLPEMKDHV